MARPDPKRKEWPLYWDRRIETMPWDELVRLAEKKLRYIIRFAYHNSKFYHGHLDEAGVSPEDIRTIQDLPKIPFIVKDDVRHKIQVEPIPYGAHPGLPDSYHYKIATSTGTTGRPTYNTWSPGEEAYARDLNARNFWAMMMRPGDVYLNAWRMDFNYAWGVRFYKTAWMMGMKVIPHGSAPIATMPQLTRRTIEELRPTVVGGTPSGLYHLARMMVEEWGIDPPFQVVHTAGEPLVREVRKKLQDIYNTEYVFDFFGFSEIPFTEMSEDPWFEGDHWWFDATVFEILDPDTKEPMGPGERGELVVTSLINHTLPIIRFNVEDIAEYREGPGGCGRTHPMFPYGVLGREEWLVKVKGLDGRFHYVLPWDVEAVVRDYPEIKDYQIIKKTRLEHDRLYVRLEPKEAPKDPDAWAKRFEEILSQRLGVPVKVEYAPPGTIQPPIWKKTYVVHEWKAKK